MLPATKKPQKKEVEKQIIELLHSSWDLVSKRNTEIAAISQKAFDLALSINSKNFMGLAMMEKALYECLVNNNYYESIQVCEHAFGFMKGEFKKKYTPYYHLNLGRNYHFIGDNLVAQKHYLECVKSLELKTHKDYFEKRWLAHAFYNLFILFNYEGAEFSQEEFLQNALALYQEIEDLSGVGNCYNSYAVHFYKTGDYPKALEFLIKAHDLAEEERSIPFLSIYCANIGLVYTKLGDLESSLHYFDKAKKYDKELNSTYHIAHTYNQMGESFATIKKHKEAIEHFQVAEKLFLELGVKRSLANIYEHLSDVYAAEGDYEHAYAYKKKYAASLKEVFNEEKTFAIAKARNEFELEKKEQEAQLLRQKNEQIEKYALQLEISNNELRQFAHVASHDLREPLRMVSSYVSLLKRSLGDSLSTDQIEFMQFITMGTQTMHSLIGDLLTLSSISFIQNKKAVDLNGIMQTVLTNLSSTVEEKQVQLEYPELPVVQADETYMIQLFQNLISNAIKYNLQPQPIVQIRYSLHGKKYTFSIRDNGIGIPVEFREKIFLIFQRLHPRDEFSGTGIGLAICKKIIDQLSGKIWVEDNAEGGSVFYFTLPAKKGVSA